MDKLKNTNSSSWGMTGLYEGRRLVFSGTFNQPRIRRETWQMLFPFFKKLGHENPESIVNNLDVYSLFSPNAKTAWREAYFLAKKNDRPVGVEDIFLALLKTPAVNNLFARFKVNYRTTQTLLQNYLRLTPTPSSQAVKRIPFEAFTISVQLHDHKIGSLMLLGALLNLTPEDNILQAIFSNIGFNFEKLEIFAGWILNLNYEFPKDSRAAKLLFCCRQAEGLEQHFGYFYEFPAIESALNFASGQTLKDLEHLKALQILIRAGLLAQKQYSKNISAELIVAAASQI